MVMAALDVDDFAAYQSWAQTYAGPGSAHEKALKDRMWQQFVIRAVDERGDPVPDYFLDVGTVEDGGFEVLDDFALDVHPFTDDPSYRCFHVDLAKLRPAERTSLSLRLIAQSGTDLVAYYGYGSEISTPRARNATAPGSGTRRSTSRRCCATTRSSSSSH